MKGGKYEGSNVTEGEGRSVRGRIEKERGKEVRE